ncbi:F-box/LRR-repeat protein 12-like isoform X2 [Dromiciops gliroides]|uniref:F-box/LRR-repeat protein 12-like isoform X2 n=1 Tax=Dromiciops gliroides TaxID=33562 RepID=UPI001CC608EC|nr:F-box/LRR-repeat protein 12-like isoform X2 [Dromiciops gliroides]
MATASELPDWLLVEILSFVPVRDRLRSSRVCKRWRRLVLDKTLWKRLDMSPYRVGPKVLWQLLRQYLGSGLRTLKVRGRLLSGPRAPLLSPALLQELGKRCPHVACLSLLEEDLRKIPFSCLPRSLRCLELQSCELPQAWFPQGNAPSSLPHLEHLVLDRVPAFSDVQLRALPRQGALCSLVLRVTYRVTHQGLRDALPGLSNLRLLELCGCSVSADGALQAMGSFLPRLRELRLTVTGLTAKGLAILVEMQTLEILGLLGPPPTPDELSAKDILTFCLMLPNLRVLSLQGMGLGSADEAILREGLVHCIITVGELPLGGLS